MNKKYKPSFKTNLEQFRINQLYENVESGGINHVRGFKRGDCYYIADDRNCAGSEMDKNRPGVIVSNDDINANNDVLLIAYFTTRPQVDSPTHIKTNVTGKPSTILVERIQAVSVERFGVYKGTMSLAEMEKVDAAIAHTFGLNDMLSAYISFTAPSPSEDGPNAIDANTEIDATEEPPVSFSEYKACQDKLQQKEQELLTINSQLQMMQTMYNQLLERMMAK